METAATTFQSHQGACELHAEADDERRSHVRVPLKLPLIINCVASESSSCMKNQRFLVRTMDISAGGLCFFSEEEVSANCVFIVLKSPDIPDLTGLRLKVVARSMHLGAPRTVCHCRFIGIDPQRQKMITELISNAINRAH